MIESPPVEGKLFCMHVARDVCDLVEIMMHKKIFYKTALANSISGKNRFAKLLEYYSCKNCFTSIMEKTTQSKNADACKDSKYKIVGIRNSYRRAFCVSEGYSESYHTIRDEIDSVMGSGYVIDMYGVRLSWYVAYSIAYSEYYCMLNGMWPKGDSLKPWESGWFACQNLSVKRALGRLARSKLASLNYGQGHKFHRRFGIFPSSMTGNACTGCGVCMEDARCSMCRFCKIPQKRSSARARAGISRLARRNLARKNLRAEQFENESKNAVISEMIGAKGWGEALSELSEDYGRVESARLMGVVDTNDAM
ncbi:MAG: hypothetical protein OXC46_02030 [Thaumarchaeota archaeon]|nr:hypothetical protein [Nitrososphaerota archaeon]